MKLTTLTIMFCLMLNQATAAPTLLHKDQVAPYEGLLFSIEESNKLRIDLLDLSLVKKEKELLLTENELVNKQLEVYRDHTQKQAERLVKAESGGLLGPIAMFLAGALVAVGITFGVNK